MASAIRFRISAAAAIARAQGVAPEVLAETLRPFKGVEHRIERVRELEAERDGRPERREEKA